MMNPRLRGRLVAFVVVVVVGVGAVWAMTQPLASSGPRSSSAPGFYALGQETQGLAVGMRVPPLESDPSTPLIDLDGQPVDLAGLRGRPVWIVFWATWCPPCQSETPDLQRAWESGRERGLEMIAVDVQEPDAAVREYVATYGLGYRVALDTTGRAMKSWGVFGLPTHYFIDADGIVRDRVYGPLTLDGMRSRLSLILPD
jgi:peroxiredoxin